MYYNSTRNSGVKITAAEAIVQGISLDGGLFLPCKIPALSMEKIAGLGDIRYSKRAAFIFSKYLTDFTEEEIRYCTESAYNDKSFDSENIVEMENIAEGVYLLELWRGPTCAFKDMALQILPYLLSVSAKKININKEIVILTATSGDTGKAALDGFKDVDGTKIIVFYPDEGVSAIQKLQMTTQDGDNVAVCGVRGNFDDCQSGVKALFTDLEVNKLLEEKGMVFSSANSINWGRLLPQIVYYVSSYALLVKNGDIKAGEKINIAVPTGNFGNILAAYLAMEMGIPVNKFICASNKNNVLTDFIKTGVYDKNREFFTTLSPSMDILISSNLERLLYIMCGRDDTLVKEWFDKLAKDGRYEVTDTLKAKLAESFYGGFCDDEQTKETIKEIYDKYSYTLDTHTAAAVRVYEDYKAETGDCLKTVIASTASPYKFGNSVIEAITSEPLPAATDEFAVIDKLFKLSGMSVPQSLSELKNKKVRFDTVIGKDELQAYVFKTINS
ncbi:MAG: threonine synthase [Oscillospiraceae bacterium]|nr:threonine synthase [Oscillospiraceae bacterium]